MPSEIRSHNFINDKPWTTPEKIETMRRLFAKEVEADAPAKKLDDIPLTYEHITKEYMTAAIAKKVPEAECTGFSLGPPDDGTANRRRILGITWNEAGQKAGLPSSVFCKGTMDLNNRLQLSFGGSSSEVNFFNHIRPIVDYLAPEALHAYIDTESCGSIIMLKDLTETADWCKYSPDITKDNVKDQFLTLAKLHGKFWESKDPLVEQFVPFALGFHAYCQTCDTESACMNGFAAAKDVIPERFFKRQSEVWPATVASYVRNGELPYTLAHGDLHIGNWYKLDGRMGLQDYQCMGRGSYARDLGYVMATAVPIEKRRQWEDELFDYYLEQLAKYGGPTIPKEEAWLEVGIQSFTVLGYWTLTLTPSPDTMPDMQPVDFTKEMIKRIATFQDDHNVFDDIEKVKAQYQKYM